MEAGRLKEERIINLYLAAMACPDEQRDAFVEESCFGDETLWAEVQRRVGWELRMGGFLLTPVVDRERFDRPFAEGETVMGRFRILHVAGEGGMGIVYEAMDEKLNRRIALKCPRFEFRKRLSPEAQNSLRVTHPNVCRVFEIHTVETNSGDVDFLTMEFVEGETLASRLVNLPPLWLATKPGADVAQQICAGLKAVHDCGVVHRDLKSGNILLSLDGRAVIMDFGIAQGAEFLTSQIRGTLDYVAPELWRGEAASPQSDIYALGVVLHEMACGGGRPFLPWAQWHERLRTVPDLASIPQPQRRVIQRCLQPDPDKRYRDAGEAAAALRPDITWRRWMIGGTTIAAAAVSLTAAKVLYWPSSPVRLAMPGPELSSGIDATMVQGVLLDIRYRLRSLRRPRRPLHVFDPEELQATHLGQRSEIGRIGATHGLAMSFQRDSASAELFDAASGRVIQRVERKAASANLAELLLAFQSDVVTMLDNQLRLRSEGQRPSIAAPVYADYLLGLRLVRDQHNAALAIPHFERVIAGAPESALGYAGLAEALLASRNAGSRALEAVAKAEQLDPESAHVLLIAGRFHAVGGNYQRALAEVQRAAELNPWDAEPLIRMAYYLFYSKRPKEAEAALEKAIQLQPGYYKPYIDAGLLQFELRDFARAEGYWREGVRLAPGLVDIRVNLGAIYQRTGRIAEARKMAIESLAIERAGRALELLADLEPPSEAVHLYEEAIRIGSIEYATWSGLGSAYLALRREADSIQAFRNGLRLVEDRLRERPNDAEIVAWCAFYHARLGEAVLARSRAVEAEALKSLQGNVRMRLALTYGWLNDLDTANRLLDGAPSDLITELRNFPDLPPAMRGNPRLKP